MTYKANGGLEVCSPDTGTIIHDAWSQPVGDGHWLMTEQGLVRLSEATAGHDSGDQDDALEGYRPALILLAA